MRHNDDGVMMMIKAIYHHLVRRRDSQNAMLLTDAFDCYVIVIGNRDLGTYLEKCGWSLTGGRDRI